MKINERTLSIFAITRPYDYEGFLNKRGEDNKAFQRRYFVLKGNLLFYFEKKIEKEPLGVIIVEGCTIEICEESEQYCFKIAFVGDRNYVLSADDQDVMEAWMKVLTNAGYLYKKLKVAELQRQLDEIEGTQRQQLNQVLPTVIPLKPPRTRTNPFNRPAPPPPPYVNGSSGEESTSHLPNVAAQTHGASSSTVNKSNTNTVLLSTIQLFEKTHEHFRKDVLSSVELYRATKIIAEKPLIDI